MSVKRSIRFLSLSHQQEVIKNEVETAFHDTFQRSHYIMGPELENFEKKFAAFCGSDFCVGVGNGLDALIISLRALNLQPDDEVIVPANTYHATWLAIKNAGAKIVPVEPDEKTFNLDSTKVSNAITTKTKVILPVHLYGQPCNMTELTRIANDAQIRIVEDNAQAHGASWKNKRTGSWGVVNATSFYPTKNLGALGDGGAITTNDEQVAEFARRYRNYGSSKKNYADEPGANSRLDELQAAFLGVKLNYLERWNNERRKLAAKYGERLNGIEGIITPFTDEHAFHVYHLYVVKATRRQELILHLAENGIEAMVHYPIPPHLQKVYQSLGFKDGNFPVTESLANCVLSLPLWVGMTEGDVDYVVDAIRRFYL